MQYRSPSPHTPMQPDQLPLSKRVPLSHGGKGGHFPRAPYRMPSLGDSSDEQEEEESSSTEDAQSYFNSRASIHSLKAAATNKMGHRVNGQPTSGGARSPEPIRPLRHPHRVSVGESSNLHSRGEHREKRAHIQDRRIDGPKDTTVHANQKSRALEASTREASPTLSPRRHDRISRGPGARGTEQADRPREPAAYPQQQGAEDPHGARISNSKRAQIREASRPASTPVYSPQEPDRHVYQTSAQSRASPKAKDNEHAEHSPKASVRPHQEKFDGQNGFPKLITVEDGSQRHRAFLVSDLTYKGSRLIEGMQRNIRELAIASGDIWHRQEFWSDTKRRLELEYEIRIPGTFPDADEDGEAHSLRDMWEFATRGLDIADQPGEELDAGQRRLLLKMAVRGIDDCEQEMVRSSEVQELLLEHLRSLQAIIVSDLVDAMEHESPL